VESSELIGIQAQKKDRTDVPHQPEGSDDTALNGESDGHVAVSNDIAVPDGESSVTRSAKSLWRLAYRGASTLATTQTKATTSRALDLGSTTYASGTEELANMDTMEEVESNPASTEATGEIGSNLASTEATEEIESPLDEAGVYAVEASTLARRHWNVASAAVGVAVHVGKSTVKWKKSNSPNVKVKTILTGSMDVRMQKVVSVELGPSRVSHPRSTDTMESALSHPRSTDTMESALSHPRSTDTMESALSHPRTSNTMESASSSVKRWVLES